MLKLKSSPQEGINVGLRPTDVEVPDGRVFRPQEVGADWSCDFSVRPRKLFMCTEGFKPGAVLGV